MIAVTLLTIGVVIAAWSDQQSKVRDSALIGEACANIIHRRMLRAKGDFLLSVLDL